MVETERAAEAVDAQQDTSEGRNGDTITSLSGLPSWLSMPALPVHRQPHALMAIDINSNRDLSLDMDGFNEIITDGDDRERRARLRVKSHQRLRSYKQIVEDFKEQAEASRKEIIDVRNDSEDRDDLDEAFGDENDFEAEDGEVEGDHSDVWYTPTHSVLSSPVSSPRKQRREDTARRSKRFSLPAVALHTTSVTARTSDTPDPTTFSRESSSGDQSSSLGLSKRFSLVLGGRNSIYSADGSSRPSSGAEGGGEAPAPHRSVAAARLSELLGRKSKAA